MSIDGFEHDDDLGELCRAARSHQNPRAEDRAAVRRGLAVKLGAAAAVGAATVASTSSASAGVSAAATIQTTGLLAAAKASLGPSFVGWLAGGVLVGGVTLAAVNAGVTGDSQSEARERASLSAAPQRPRTVAPARAAPFEAPGDQAPDTGRESAAPEAKVERSIAPASRGSARPTLLDETRALAAIQRALRDGHSEQALTLLQESDRAYRNGRLGAERAGARVLALCASGRRQEARAQARQFLNRHPSSPLAERIRDACQD